MKDAKGHGSDPRGAHSAGVDQIGRVPIQPGLWYHGSPIGEPGLGPIHVGTKLAATEALEARIGVRADGKPWDGTQEYGKTKLAGTTTLAKMADKGQFKETGFNVDAPVKDYYPGDRKDHATMTATGKPIPIPLSAKPAIHTYNIAGHMSNSTTHPTTDTRANAVARRLKNQGTYYKNEGEDGGSVSAVVPNKTFLRRTS